MTEHTLLRGLLTQAGFDLPDEMIAQLVQLWHLVDSAPFNVTAIKTFDEAARKHIVDSLMLLVFAQPQGALLDVGSGGGFPGLPLAIARPDLDVTLLDATAKKARFCDDTARSLDLVNAHGLAGRAETFGRDAAYRERYDVCVSRAVAELAVLCELCLPLTAVGGMFYAYKGAAADDEVAAAQRAVAALGGTIEQVHHYTLEGGDARALVAIRKTAPTDKRYPRAYGQITKKPL